MHAADDRFAIFNSALILGRLMWHDRMVRMHHLDENSDPSIHWTVARTIIQSQALYSLTVGATLVTYVVHSEVFFAVSSMASPLVVGAPGRFSPYHS